MEAPGRRHEGRRLGRASRPEPRRSSHRGRAPVDKALGRLHQPRLRGKAAFVPPAAGALEDDGVKVWYDTFNLRPGLSLGSSIDAGIAGAEFGIVVLSPHFIAKEWPRYEFDALSERRTGKGEPLITLWHGLNPEERPAWTQRL